VRRSGVGFWGAQLVDQLDFYVEAHLLPRLDGLDDEEYFWGPVDDCWSVRADASGEWHIEHPPVNGDGGERVTTIAWRMAHVAVLNLGTRARCFFDPDTDDTAPNMFHQSWMPAVPAGADQARELLVAMWQQWRDGVLTLSDERLAASVGPRGGPFAEEPFAGLVLHVSRETMHHGGEIGVLRDLYRARSSWT